MNLISLTYYPNVLNATLCGTFVGSAFTGKEKDSESGYHYFGARYYDSELLTGWLSVDPMMDKYPSLSPYNYCAWTRPTGGDEHRWIKYNIVNNPMKFVDPDGKEYGDFYNKYGELIGSDGQKDGKVYIERNGPDATTSTWSLLKAKLRVRFHSGNVDYFKSNTDIYENFIEILPLNLIQQAHSSIGDNGKGGEVAANNMEYGGYANADGTAWEKTDAVSMVGDPSKQEYLPISIGGPGRIKYHSHCSGSKYISMGDIASGNSMYQNGSVVGRLYYWNQSPSDIDIRNAGNTINYVFGMGNGTMSVYNDKGVQSVVNVKRLLINSKSN